MLQEYKKYLPKNKDKIIDILILEGKYKLGRKIKFEGMGFTEFIQAPEYVISNLDIWIMMEKYNIPTILISSKTILQTNDTKKIFTLVPNREDLDSYIFVTTSAHLTTDSILKYSLIQTNTRKMDISLSSAITNEICLRTISESISNWLNIRDYLKNYVIIPNRGNVVKKINPAINFVIEEDSDNSEGIEVTKVVKTILPEKVVKTRKVKIVNNKNTSKKIIK